MPPRAEAIRVRGIVQGVGFRPAVWCHAREEHICGRVWNDSEGVLIHAWGSKEQLDRFVHRISSNPPPLAVIDVMEREPLDDPRIPQEFTIVASEAGDTRTGVAADAATCPVCLQEVIDPVNRRYRYPFTNCTHCGPRLSIVRAVPYDRANTSMDVFTQCPRCQAEYDNPADRRFHAQPNACPECGPTLWLEERGGGRVEPEEGTDAIDVACKLIEHGHIVAIKGIGGIHLACDAGNEQAVDTLRQRKQRYHKAFALMARDCAMIGEYAVISKQEQALLERVAAPIVILRQQGTRLATGIAPGQNTLGFMLPYTPLHHLMMAQMQRPIVLTSGNHSDEPQCIDNDDARERLSQIADYWLLHDRDIINRLDDSVARVVDNRPVTLRRARGFAPESMPLPAGFEVALPMLAMGAELKNSFCLLKQGRAVLSQHMGDLEDAATFADYRHNLSLYRQLFDLSPEVIVVDRHPDYLSTQLGRAMAAEEGTRLIEVQHHHAHIAACMVEKGMPLDCAPVLGVALDGLGFGDDGTLWGGEFLLADYRGCERLAHFAPIAMPGGTQAIREPWRNAYAHLIKAIGWERLERDFASLEIVRFLQQKPLSNLKLMVERGLNTPDASSCGRLFDAAAAVIGICRESVSFEGQAAIEMEAMAEPRFQEEASNGYPCKIEMGGETSLISWEPLWEALLTDLEQGFDTAIVAARFHHGIANAVVDSCQLINANNGVKEVVLSGGVFQNRLLLERVAESLRQAGLTVHYPEKIPANDGGVSLGQAAIAAAQMTQ